MPANRSRTERFQESFRQVCDRGGCLEFAIAPRFGDTSTRSPDRLPDLVWRVKLLHVDDHELIVERPTAAGKGMALQENLELMGALVIGQNRWQFTTKTLPATGKDRVPGALRLAMPQSVERCSRRESSRVAIQNMTLPDVEVWPLLEPSSVVAAEQANRTSIHEAYRVGTASPDGHAELSHDARFADDLALPIVGPKFGAKLMNVGGGGLGLVVDRSETSAASRAKLVWLCVNLTPLIPKPLGLTAKIVHTHIDSMQNLYAGLAFEFAFHPSHRDFVIEQIERYIATLQGQHARRAA